jgi:AraC-like DNA-binding protein
MNLQRNPPRSTPNTFGSSQVLLCRDGLTVSTVTLSAGRRFASHAHQLDQLCVVLQGHYEESCKASSRVSLQPGSVVWRRAGRLHTNTVGAEEVQAILADIEPQRSNRLALSSMGSNAYFVPGTFDEIHRELLHEANLSDPTSHLAIEALVCLLAARVSRHGKLPDAAMPEWLFRAMKLIRSEYSSSLSLSQIAAASGVHRVTLAVAFRHHLGRSVGTYIADLRVAHARRELQTTHRPIAEIAQEAGFYDESHMGRVFRRRFRVSPGVLRSQPN